MTETGGGAGPDDKASAPFFTGSINFVALSIPSIALLLAIYDKVYAVPELQMRTKFLINLAVVMMVAAGAVAFLALLRLSGWWMAPIGLIAAILAVLIVLAPLVTVGIVFGYAG